MKKFRLYQFVVVLMGLLFVYLYFYSHTIEILKQIKPVKGRKNETAFKSPPRSSEIVISLVACDERYNQTVTLMKSVLLFTRTPVHFYIFADDNLRNTFTSEFPRWRDKLGERFHFTIKPIKFPEKYSREWLNLFKKCASQRLFIPSLLPEVDAMIYVDTDTVFLDSAERLWKEFADFNETQIAALAPETDDPNIAWYPRFAKHPFYGKCGLNSGVMLMNLTRMRQVRWEEYVTPVMLQWRQHIPWGDQDIINVIFHYHGEWVRALGCEANYRSEQCQYGRACSSALVLHGNRDAFRADRHPALAAVYESFHLQSLEEDAGALRARLAERLEAAPEGSCRYELRRLPLLQARPPNQTSLS